jgi:phosphate starvation-inducible PhoH-like protein
MEAIDDKNLIMALGPAGTGKTYIAIAKAVEALEAGKVGRIVLSRPAVEAGESIGYLPGDMEDKLAPYLRPLYDALSDRLSVKRMRALMAEGAIEIAPVGFMRGRTLNNAFVVIDEAQNCTYMQLKMLLTRLGWNSTMVVVVTGDPNQSDLLPFSGISGLGDVTAEKFEALDREHRGAFLVRLADRDIVRHPLVAEMLASPACSDLDPSISGKAGDFPECSVRLICDPRNGERLKCGTTPLEFGAVGRARSDRLNCLRGPFMSSDAADAAHVRSSPSGASCWGSSSPWSSPPPRSIWA